MFIDDIVTVVSDRLVTVNESKDIEVRLVHTGQVLLTIRAGHDYGNRTLCITLVPDHSELLVTGHSKGGVHLWDIGDKGARACDCMNVNAGVHVRQIVRLEKRVNEIVASSMRLMCSYGDYKTMVAILHFNNEKS